MVIIFYKFVSTFRKYFIWMIPIDFGGYPNFHIICTFSTIDRCTTLYNGKESWKVEKPLRHKKLSIIEVMTRSWRFQGSQESPEIMEIADNYPSVISGFFHFNRLWKGWSLIFASSTSKSLSTSTWKISERVENDGKHV